MLYTCSISKTDSKSDFGHIRSTLECKRNQAIENNFSLLGNKFQKQKLALMH